MYNLGVPAALKAWIDHIVRSEKRSPTNRMVWKGMRVDASHRYCSQRRRLCRNPIGSVGPRDPISEAHPGFIGISDVTLSKRAAQAALHKGRFRKPNSSFPFSRRRVMRSSNCRDAHTAQNLLTGNSRRSAFEPGLLSLILSTLTGEHDAQGIA